MLGGGGRVVTTQGPEQGVMARGFPMHLPELASPLTQSHWYCLRLDQQEGGEVGAKTWEFV